MAVSITICIIPSRILIQDVHKLCIVYFGISSEIRKSSSSFLDVCVYVEWIPDSFIRMSCCHEQTEFWGQRQQSRFTTSDSFRFKHLMPYDFLGFIGIGITIYTLHFREATAHSEMKKRNISPNQQLDPQIHVRKLCGFIPLQTMCVLKHGIFPKEFMSIIWNINIWNYVSPICPPSALDATRCCSNFGTCF